MRAIIVLEFDLHSNDDVVEIMKALDPPQLPHFAGTARIAVGLVAAQVTTWLDASDDNGGNPPAPLELHNEPPQ